MENHGKPMKIAIDTDPSPNDIPTYPHYVWFNLSLKSPCLIKQTMLKFHENPNVSWLTNYFKIVNACKC